MFTIFVLEKVGFRNNLADFKHMKSKNIKPGKAAKGSEKKAKKALEPDIPKGKAAKLQANQRGNQGDKVKVNEVTSSVKPVKAHSKKQGAGNQKSKLNGKETVIAVDTKTKPAINKKSVKDKTPVVLKDTKAKKINDKIKKGKSKKKKTVILVVENNLAAAKKLSKKDEVKLIIESEPKPQITISSKEDAKPNNINVTDNSKSNSVGWKYFLDKHGFPLMKIYTESPAVFFKLEKLGNIKKSARYYSDKGNLIGADFIVPYDLIQTACNIAGIKAPKNLINTAQPPLPQVF